jgi:glycosyltransferase involved in cell wall biosynthesis
MHLVAYTDAESFGGAEQSLATLLAFLDARIRVTVLGTRRSIVEAIAAGRAGASSKVVPAVRAKWDLRAILSHIAALRALRADVCHINLRTPYACQYGLLAAILARGVRTVAVEHLMLHTESPFRRWLKRRTSSRLAAHVAVSERMARLVEEDAALPRGSIGVIRNGVPGHSAGAAAQRLAPGPVIGSVGRLDPQKGFDVLIDALSLLEGVTGVVVGDGDERAALERRAEQAGVADRFILTGWTSTVADLLRGFDLFVLASRYEGVPLVLLEAMEAELAVVATDVGGIAEAVTPEKTGLLVPPEDPPALAAAIRRLLDDQQLLHRLGRRGREVWAAEFTAPLMAAAYERVYRGTH